MHAASHDLRSDGKGPILLSVASGWFLSMGVRYLYPSILPFLMEEFDIGLTVSGLLLTVLWSAYAVGQFPGGLIGDRIGARNILFASTAVSTVGILIVLSSVSVQMLFVGSIAFGLATAFYSTMRFTIFTDLYPERSGTAIGLTMASGSLGNTVLPAGAAVVATYSTWRLGFAGLVPLFTVVAVALWTYVPRNTESTEESTELSGDILRILFEGVRRNRIPIVVTAHVLLAVASMGFLGFFPTYLVQEKDFSPGRAATLYGLYFAVGAAIQPLAGLAKDRYGSRRTLSVLAFLFTLGLFAVRHGRSIWFFLFVTILLSHRNGVGVVTNTYIADSLPTEVKSSGLGLLRTTWVLAGAVSPIFVGYLGDRGRLKFAFFVLACLAGVATVLTTFIQEQRE